VGSVKKVISTGIVVAALGLVPMASAGSSLLSGYGSPWSKPIVVVQGVSTSTATSKSASPKVTSNGPARLPFTGVDLAVFVAAGAGLVIVGFGVRKLGRDEN
jgi:hypothetical protein